MSISQQKWDTAYEWKAVTLLGLGFGLVGLDRWIIAPLFPCMVATGVAEGCGAPGLGLDYGGAIAKNTGIQNILWMPLVGVSLGAVVSLLMKETAPAKIERLAARAAAE